MNDTTNWEEKFVEKFGYLEQKGKAVTGLVIVEVRSILSSQKQAIVEMIESKRKEILPGTGLNLGHNHALDDILNELTKI